MIRKVVLFNIFQLICVFAVHADQDFPVKCRTGLRDLVVSMGIPVAISSGMTVGLCSLSGCASPDFVFKASNPAIAQLVPNLETEIKSKFNDRRYRWVLQVYFNGHDFGHSRSLQTILISPEQSWLRERLVSTKPNEARFFKESILAHDLPKGSAPEDYRIDSGTNPSWVGSLWFHYDQSAAAIHLISNWVDNPAKTLDETFLIVTGGSHGADEVSRFISGLRKKFAKEPEMIILGDAIAQPGPFPLLWFFERPVNSIAVNLYQRNSLVSGVAIPGFINIRLSHEDHGSAVQFAQQLGELMGEKMIPNEPTGMTVFQGERHAGTDRDQTQNKSIERLFELEEAKSLSADEIDHVVRMMKAVSNDGWTFRKYLFERGRDDLSRDAHVAQWLGRIWYKGGPEALAKVALELKKDPHSFSGFEYVFWNWGRLLLRHWRPGEGVSKADMGLFIDLMESQERFKRQWIENQDWWDQGKIDPFQGERDRLERAAQRASD